MASCSTRVPEKPHFFRIILPHTIEDKKIAIPKKFAREYGDTLSSPVLLQDPFGEIWDVQLSNYDDNLWLQDGWSEFVDHYSVEQGQFITFRYEGSSLFSVVIYGTCATEIAYPSTSTAAPCIEEPNCYLGFEESEESKRESESGVFETLDEVTPSRKRKESSSEPDVREKKTMRTGDGTMSPTLEYLQPKVMRKIQKLLAKDQQGAIQKALGFETENPFFIVRMYKTYIFEPKQVCVPLPFANDYFIGTEGDITLQVVDGRTWGLKYKVYTELRRCQMTNGWRKFVWENSLQLHDLCIFELINTSDLTLKVTIFREIEIADCHKVTDSADEEEEPVVNKHKIKEGLSKDHQISQVPEPVKIEPAEEDVKPLDLASPEALRAAVSFKSVNPFFKIVVHAGYVRGENLAVSKDFCASHFPGPLKTVQLRVGKVSWPVKLQNSEGRARQFSDGWTAFVRQNDLKPGHICVFEMVRKRPTILNVTIFR